MPGATIQLQARGIQDTYLLTEEVSSNFFEYGYRKYVNFASEVIKIPTLQTVNWGKKVTALIPRHGHLLSNVYLKLEIPELTKTSGDWVSYSDTLGYGILNKLELEIGGIIVETLQPQYMDIVDELTQADGRKGKNLMILKSDTYVAARHNAETSKTLMIPLPFFFTKQYNLSLPLIALTNPEIKINMEFKSFDECIHYNGVTGPVYKDIISADIYGEYMYLDESLIPEFENRDHHFLVDSVQYNEIESISPNLTTHVSSLKFNHPVRELLFVLVDENSITNNDHFNYSRYSDEASLLMSASLYLENHSRFDDLPEVYLRTVFPYKQHSVIPNRYIYMMPFALNAESNQPSGALNFSRFDNVSLHLKLRQHNPEVLLYVFAVYHNFITISNGSLFVEFST